MDLRIAFYDKRIRVEQIVCNPDHIRLAMIELAREDDAWLLASIRRFGVLQPLVVNERRVGRYKLIDGHRRILCARQVGLRFVRCRVHVGLDAGEVEMLRFELKHARTPWTPTAHAGFRSRLKKRRGDRTAVA